MPEKPSPKRVTYQDIVDRAKPVKLRINMGVWVIYSGLVRSGIIIDIGEKGVRVRLRNQDEIPVALSHIRERFPGDSKSSSISSRGPRNNR